ncbi:hypothetical protein J433_09147 [Corynebacterium glutamicum MT]|uniref:Uncharacterized protein n=1 Tax=Corynebacterium glutamicum TaxID=1718 RepID=A0AB36IBQ3_CORGT|nr:hypothetical protein C624_14565 [Corynebacterium glutamicum SCgG1]AGN23503.1 hypothetical protein C629_14575 [Corynebacterium glutamicum SCgG2]EGV39053.1 hypothetical protein CgS9114_15203 [Corynebacterium glutamicum S9114]EOA64399.1 hypothetical protein J433_09147 [Corynebacterium glutamicum MT]EPP39446.1 hypothetical protein A583_14088 [Corynebacterium glutamicum Z188]OKX78802.1 hypothetical protein AUP69_11585 [Corynebacterium glutamicum]
MVKEPKFAIQITPSTKGNTASPTLSASAMAKGVTRIAVVSKDKKTVETVDMSMTSHQVPHADPLLIL